MGQQQLLLLGLGMLIVGIAVVVGINMLTANAKSGEENAMEQECVSLINAAQVWVRKAPGSGGPPNQNDYSTLDFSFLGKFVAVGTLSWSNQNGDNYLISLRGPNTFTLRATGRNGTPVITYSAINCGVNNLGQQLPLPTPVITR